MKKIQIKGKDYIPVNERIKEFRRNEEFKGFSLTSRIVSHENGVIIIEGIIKNKEGEIVATGMACEKDGSSFINKTSYIENCETSAWGRVLGNLGIGSDTSIASLEEVANAINIRDNTNTNTNNNTNNNQKSENEKSWLNEADFVKLTANKQAFIDKFGNGEEAVNRLRKAYKVSRAIASKVEALFE